MPKSQTLFIPWGFQSKFCMHFLFRPCMPLYHPSWFTNVSCTVDIVKLLVTQFYPVHWYFNFLKSYTPFISKYPGYRPQDRISLSKVITISDTQGTPWQLRTAMGLEAQSLVFDSQYVTHQFTMAFGPPSWYPAGFTSFFSRNKAVNVKLTQCLKIYFICKQKWQ
jgi:hypothetical protein